MCRVRFRDPSGRERGMYMYATKGVEKTVSVRRGPQVCLALESLDLTC